MYNTPFQNEILENKIMQASHEYLDCRYKKYNVEAFMEYSFVPDYYKRLKDFQNENKVLFPADKRLCDKEVIRDRGQNNVNPTNLKDAKFLLPVCPQNTYRNHLVCDKTKCCSSSHQLFMNHTKRTTGRAANSHLC